MMADIKRIRRCLSDIEMEAGTKHPERPNYRIMAREAEEAQYLIGKIQRDIKDLGEF